MYFARKNSLNEKIAVEKVVIYSLLGTEVLATSDESINISNLSEGIYFVNIATSEGNITKKIVKE